MLQPRPTEVPLLNRRIIHLANEHNCVAKPGLYTQKENFKVLIRIKYFAVVNGNKLMQETLLQLREHPVKRFDLRV